MKKSDKTATIMNYHFASPHHGNCFTLFIDMSNTEQIAEEGLKTPRAHKEESGESNHFNQPPHFLDLNSELVRSVEVT